MIVLSWNIRGLGARIKRSSIRKLINKHSPHLVFIQETKVEDVNARIINSIWKEANLQWVFSPSHGNSGGILALWNSEFFSIDQTKVEKHWIALVGEIRALHFRCTLITIYNPCTVAERSVIWLEIAEFQNLSQFPCFLIGDFNETLEPSERGSQFISANGSNDFRNFLQEQQLLEISPLNGGFTWFRGASKSKLDRLFVSSHWITTFPHLKVSLLKRSVSDHCPLLALSKEKNWDLDLLDSSTVGYRIRGVQKSSVKHGKKQKTCPLLTNLGQLDQTCEAGMFLNLVE